MMFKLTPIQQIKLNGWMQHLNHKIKSGNFGAIAGIFTYEFTPTGIGDVVKVYFLKGTAQEQYIDLTEYELW